MDLLKDFNFIMTCIIHKMLVLLKNYLNYFKDNIFECFLKKYNRVFFNQFISQHITLENLRLEEENIIKDVRNLFRLKKQLNHTAIKDIRNIFRQEKEIKARIER